MSRKLFLAEVREVDFSPIAGTVSGRIGDFAPLRQPVRGVLFDICNVLYDDTVWRRWLLKVLTRLGLHTSYRSFFRVWDREYLADVYRGRIKFDEAFRGFLFSAGLSAGQIEEVEAACQARRCELQQTARPLPGVQSTLASLHRSGIAMAAVANSEHPQAVVRQQIRRFTFEGLFAAIMSSIDMGCAMPDPACYLIALKALGMAAAEVAFVGHDAAVLAGAAAVGMPTVAFNYDPDAQADVYLDRFEDLYEATMSSRPKAAAG